MDTAVSLVDVGLKYDIIRKTTVKKRLFKLFGRDSVVHDFWALRHVTFDIPRGSVFGILGRNGAGKTSLLKLVAGVLQPDEGHVSVSGKVAPLLALGAGFQPELSGMENIYLNGLILGLSRSKIRKLIDEIVDFAELEEFIYQPVKNYSSGMRARLGFAIAVHSEPEILLVDEVLSVGDAEFKQKCARKVGEIIGRENTTAVIVTHSPRIITDMCTHAAWIDRGRLMSVGRPDATLAMYMGGPEIVAERIAAND